MALTLLADRSLIIKAVPYVATDLTSDPAEVLIQHSALSNLCEAVQTVHSARAGETLSALCVSCNSKEMALSAQRGGRDQYLSKAQQLS